jgi:hypothetical protein
MASALLLIGVALGVVLFVVAYAASALDRNPMTRRSYSSGAPCKYPPCPTPNARARECETNGLLHVARLAVAPGRRVAVAVATDGSRKLLHSNRADKRSRKHSFARIELTSASRKHSFARIEPTSAPVSTPFAQIEPTSASCKPAFARIEPTSAPRKPSLHSNRADQRSP